MARLAALDLKEIHFSEVTVGCADDSEDDDNAEGTCEERWTDYMSASQAQLYSGLLQICLDEPKCTVFQLWGAVDGWTGAYTGEGSYPFNTKYKPKESWYATSKKIRFINAITKLALIGFNFRPLHSSFASVLRYTTSLTLSRTLHLTQPSLSVGTR